MKLILASDPNGGIGYENRLPWSKIQGDLPRFKRLTDGQPVVMGRNTWDSLPIKPLPNSINIVVSSKPLEIEYNNVIHMTDVKFNVYDFYWIIGGAKLIESCWNNIHEVHLTKTFTEYTCDTFIDLVYLENNFVRRYNEVFPDHEYQIWNRK